MARITEFTADKNGIATLAEMVFDPVSLGLIATRWDDAGLFTTAEENRVGAFCVAHHRKYGTAPGRKGVESWWEEETSGNGHGPSYRLTESVIEQVLAREPVGNPQVAADRAGRHINRVALQKLRDEIDNLLQRNKVNQATESVEAFRRVRLGFGEALAPFSDPDCFRHLFSQERIKPLVEFEGDVAPLNDLFQDQLGRGQFVSFMAPDKTGKSFWLMELAYLAMCQRSRVAFFEVGDMTKDQVLTRLLVRNSRHPLRSRKWPVEARWPISLKAPARGEEGPAAVEHKPLVFKSPLDFEKAKASLERLRKRKIKSSREWFRLEVHPSGSMSVNGMRGILDTWALDGWVPDVVVVDYADLLDSANKKADRRDQINDVWMALRRLSQELNCLVLTATQSDADAYARKVIDRRNFSEDKRKLAHTTAMVGINVIGEEKERGICRLNMVTMRDGEYVTGRCWHVAGCLALARPLVLAAGPWGEA